MRTKKAIINIAMSLLLELVTIIYGFIVPRLFIGSFGSEVNGLVNSISNFIGYITLLQSGAGSVIKSVLYKPLAQNDTNTISVVVKTSKRFFDKIGIATVGYIIILMVLYPILVSDDYGYAYTASLVVILGLGTCAQYFFGVTYQMVLEADQKVYIYSIVQVVAIIINTIMSIILIKAGCSVHIVKISNAAVYVFRPWLIRAYVKRKYHIQKNVEINNELIKQRWDGFIQAIAYFIHSKTDVFVLTVFSTLSDVSIYSVYALVTGGLTAVITAIDKAVRSAFGNIIACNETENLKRTFNIYNYIVHSFCTIVFATAAITVYSFVRVYTRGITDANYIQYTFGFLIISAEYIYCLRMPYNSIIFVEGKFKETKKPASIEAILNIVLSCILVPQFGLSGVALGTLIAMSYRTISFACFLKYNILFLSFREQVRQYFTSFVGYVVSILLFKNINIGTYSYILWALYAACIFIGVSVTVLIINFLFNEKNTRASAKMIKARLIKKKL